MGKIAGGRMPVRAIKPNPRSVTGRLPATRQHPALEFESTLERDFLTALQNDSSVQRIETQPLHITYTDEHGKARRYTPDVLVEYAPISQRPPTLYEVKYFEALRTDRDTLRSAFVAAAGYARERGWRFRVVTERALRETQPLTLIPTTSVDSSLDNVSPAALHTARERLEAIRPLLRLRARGSSAVRARAEEVGVHPNSLYRWLERYTLGGARLSSLLPKSRRDQGHGRLDPEVDQIIERAIEDVYLNAQRCSITELFESVLVTCRAQSLKPPHLNTVRKRVAALEQRRVVRTRLGQGAARRLEPVRGSFQTTAPLAVAQVDHMLLDVIVVDEVQRRPIGRPWLSLAFDVYSRMVLGFYLTLEPPSALSVGVCLSNAMLPKKPWLDRAGVVGSWPCSGVMQCLHMDNAREFHSEMLQQACDEFGITLMFRPLARPQYGGHIERMLGSLARKLHTLAGTTFSNQKERGEYDSDGNAALSLAELERWLLTYIVDVYHQRVHSALNGTPLRRWLDHRGASPAPEFGIDERERIRLAFLPMERRTIQRHGVRWDGILYFSDALKPHIYARDGQRGQQRRRFIFKRDPRDISVIYFLEPASSRYVTVGCRRVDRHSVSLWEYRSARRLLREQGRAQVDEEAVFTALERLRVIERNAVQQTRSVRKVMQRKRDAVSARAAFTADLPAPSVPPPSDQGWVEHVEPFEEIVVKRTPFSRGQR
jgi:putative transposase